MKTVDNKDYVDMIIKESAVIEKIVNEQLLKEFAKLHRIPDDYNILKVKQEVVADKAYFLNVKKRYALHIINREGVDVEEFEVKGIDIRRSDFPSKTKENLNTILNFLLKEKTISFNKIREFIYSTRRELIHLTKQGDTSVGRSTSFSKDLSEYCSGNYPTHIRSMLFWNEYIYHYFEQGTRGYMYSLSGIDEEKAPKKLRDNLFRVKHDLPNYIVIPIDELKVPDYFILDIEGHVNTIWDRCVERLLQPIYDKIHRDKSADAEINFEDL